VLLGVFAHLGNLFLRRPALHVFEIRGACLENSVRVATHRIATKADISAMGFCVKNQFVRFELELNFGE
jgi:hypothetical protein